MQKNPESQGKSKVSSEAMASHISQLCEKHGISLQLAASNRGRAWRRTRIIKVPAVRSATTYALALHEIGHVVGKQTGYRLNREYQAWEWAIGNAMAWSPAMAEKMRKSLATYVAWCQRRRGVTVPPSDHPVWAAAGCDPIQPK